MVSSGAAHCLQLDPSDWIKPTGFWLCGGLSENYKRFFCFNLLWQKSIRTFHTVFLPAVTVKTWDGFKTERRGFAMRRSSESGISVILRPSQRVLMSMFFIPSRSAPENLSEKISLSLTISPVQHWLYFIRSTFLSQRLSAFAGITNARCLIKLKIHFFTLFLLKCKLLHFRESVLSLALPCTV